MADTQTTGAETTAPAQSQNAQSNEPQTLDDVYSKFNVEETAKEFQTQTQPAAPTPPRQEQSQTQVNVPDPVLDSAGFKAWHAANAHETQNLRQALANIQGHLGNMQRAALLQREEADIKQAVETVNARLDQKLDPDVVEIGLGQMARRDPKFMSVYQNRYKNPQAWTAALGVAAKQLGSKFAMKTDPNIAENVRALKEATSGKATTDKAAPSSMQERLEKATGAEFDRLISQVRRRQA